MRGVRDNLTWQMKKNHLLFLVSAEVWTWELMILTRFIGHQATPGRVIPLYYIT